MKRFRFRLGKVLAVRQIRERIAEAELGLARSHLAHEQERLDQINQSIERSIGSFRTELQVGIEPNAVISHYMYIERLRGDSRQQVTRVEAARREVLRKQDALVHARQERKGLDKLRERQYQDYTRFALLEEQKVLDDIRRAERR